MALLPLLSLATTAFAAPPMAYYDYAAPPMSDLLALTGREAEVSSLSVFEKTFDVLLLSFHGKLANIFQILPKHLMFYFFLSKNQTDLQAMADYGSDDSSEAEVRKVK